MIDFKELVAEAERREAARRADPEYMAELAEREQAKAAKLAKQKLAMWDSLFADAVPARVARFAADPGPTPAVAAANRWLDSDRSKDLMLRGGVGCGKSTAIAWIIRQLVEPLVVETDGDFPYSPSFADGRPYAKRARSATGVDYGRHLAPDVTWLRPDSLVSAIMHAYDDKAPRLERFVVIDDMGRELRHEFAECFCELLDRDGHTLLITTNMTRDDIRKKYDARIIDRLRERAMAVDIKGESMRKGKGDF